MQFPRQGEGRRRTYLGNTNLNIIVDGAAASVRLQLIYPVATAAGTLSGTDDGFFINYNSADGSHSWVSGTALDISNQTETLADFSDVAHATDELLKGTFSGKLSGAATGDDPLIVRGSINATIP